MNAKKGTIMIFQEFINMKLIFRILIIVVMVPIVGCNYKPPVTHLTIKIDPVLEKNKKVFNEKISEIVDSNNTIKLNDLTSFEWDKVYFFDAYASKENIYDTIGYKWGSITFPGEYGMQIVFVKNNKVVCNIVGNPNLNDDVNYLITSTKKELYFEDDPTFMVNCSERSYPYFTLISN